MIFTPVYYKTMDAIAATGRYVSSCGGTRSGKTFANLQALFQLACLDEKPTLTSVVSETFPHLKRGAIRDFQAALGDYYDDRSWNKSDSTYTLPHNGAVIEFFSADASSKVHGPARDRLFLNEIQNIPHEIARQLFVRTRGLVLMDYNPTHSFWANEQIEQRPNCVTIHSTYKDNSFLSAEQIAEIEANRHDRNWWQVYGEGKIGTLEGLIYSFDQIDEMPDADGLRETWGMDFGFTHDPTAIVRVLADTGKKEIFVDEIEYRTGMVNPDIADVLRGQSVPRQVHVWADAAEPKSIAEIGMASGCNVLPCDKSAPVRSDRLKFQLLWMQGWKIHVTKRSLNLIRELRNYTWAKDKDGKLLDQPVDVFNHALDAMRYALFSELAGNEGTGQYVIGFKHRRR